MTCLTLDGNWYNVLLRSQLNAKITLSFKRDFENDHSKLRILFNSRLENHRIWRFVLISTIRTFNWHGWHASRGPQRSRRHHPAVHAQHTVKRVPAGEREDRERDSSRGGRLVGQVAHDVRVQIVPRKENVIIISCLLSCLQEYILKQIVCKIQYKLYFSDSLYRNSKWIIVQSHLCLTRRVNIARRRAEVSVLNWAHRERTDWICPMYRFCSLSRQLISSWRVISSLKSAQWR